jgi:hypothetical protein
MARRRLHGSASSGSIKQEQGRREMAKAVRGDVTPAARAAPPMAICEALVGRRHPAMIPGRLVSLPQESP